MAATVTDEAGALRRVLLRMSGALDETSAELDRLALIVEDDPHSAAQSAAAVITDLAERMEREATNAIVECHA